MRSLLSLPAELLASILSYLDAYDLLNCSASSIHLFRLISTSSKLQYTISLAKHKLLSILPDSSQYPSYATRLKVLKAKERAWRELEWRGRRQLKLPPTGSVYEFVGGIYGNGREDENRVTASISFLELPGLSVEEAVEGHTTREQIQEIRSVASEGKGEESRSTRDTKKLRTWTHAMGDVAIIDFTMDPSQDLLVLVALAPTDSKYLYNLHLRTISTNEPHPKAPLPILSCLERHPTVPLPPELFPAVRVQVSGELVGLLIKEAPDPVGAHLEIWNWENDPDFPCSMSSQHGIDDFTFLSRSAFLIVLPVGRFEVYTFPNPLTSCITSASVSSSNGSNPSFSLSGPLLAPGSSGSGSTSVGKGCTPTRKYSYDFPELSPGYMYWYISMSCNPSPGYVPSQDGRTMNPFPPSSSYYDTPSPPSEAEYDNKRFSGEDASHFDSKPGGWSNEADEAVNQQFFYPLPDERIHACCIYIFNPNNHTNIAAANGVNNNSQATTMAAATPSTSGSNIHVATPSGSSLSGNGATPASATTAPTGASNLANNDDVFIDDDLDEDNHQVHSFVFFLNLKTLLNPPSEWFHNSYHARSTSTGNGITRSSPFAASAGGLGPLWKSSSSPPFNLPVGSNLPPSLVPSTAPTLSRGMDSGHPELSGAAALESSLNALKRRQEEKELRDAKAALDAHATVNAKKKKKNGGSSSSLAVEVSLSESRSTPSPPKSIISSPKASTSSSSGPTYPPFPTFSSPFTSSPSGSRNISTSGSGTTGISTRSIPRTLLTDPSSNSSIFGSPSSLSAWGRSATMIPPHSPSHLREASDFDADWRTTILVSGDARYTHRSQSSNGNMTSSLSLEPEAPMRATVSSSSIETTTSLTPASKHTTSPSKMRSASVPPMYNGVHFQSQSNNHSSTLISSASLPQSPTTSASTSPAIHLTQNNTQSQSHNRRDQNRSTSSYHRAQKRSTHQPVPWEIWGPPSTRWFEECLSTDWQHAIYGLRTVESVNARERDEERERQRSLVNIRELKRKREMMEAETKRPQKEGEMLDIEDERLELEIMSNTGSTLGRKKLENAKTEEAKRNQSGAPRQLQKENELDLILQAIVSDGVRKKKKKGKQKEGAQDLKKDTEDEFLEMEREEDFSGEVEANDRRRHARGKQKEITSADLDSDDKLVSGIKTFLEQPDPWDANHIALDEDEREDVLQLDSGIPLISDSDLNNELSIEQQSIQGGSNGLNSEPAPPTRRRPRRFLRVRDFNPYSLKLAEAEAEAGVRASAHINGIHTDSMTSSNLSKGKGKQRVLPSPSLSSTSHSYSYPYPIHLNINTIPPFSPFTIPSTHCRPTNPRMKTISNLNLADEELAYKAWGKRRVVREPSITPVKGVFKEDIVSWLPYTEVVSEETFEVTDVMMDDSRLLLLKASVSVVRWENWKAWKC